MSANTGALLCLHNPDLMALACGQEYPPRALEAMLVYAWLESHVLCMRACFMIPMRHTSAAVANLCREQFMLLSMCHARMACCLIMAEHRPHNGLCAQSDGAFSARQQTALAGDLCD